MSIQEFDPKNKGPRSRGARKKKEGLEANQGGQAVGTRNLIRHASRASAECRPRDAAGTGRGCRSIVAPRKVIHSGLPLYVRHIEDLSLEPEFDCLPDVE